MIIVRFIDYLVREQILFKIETEKVVYYQFYPYEKGNFHAGPIAACCKGKRHIHNGYQWIYKKDYNPNKNYEYIPGKTNNKIYIAISVANIDRKPVNIKILYGAEDLRINGFTPKNVSQVITGAKKSHAGYIFLDFFKLHKEEKEKYINLIDITTKIQSGL